MNTRERITNFKLKIMSENSRKEECSRIFLHVGTFILHGTFWLFIMNFTSLQKLAKNFTQFSSFDETLIIGALSSTSLSKENLNELTNLATQMITFCKENKCIPDNTAELENETGKRTKTELFQLFLSKFKKDLLNYEHQETLDKFEVNVPEYLFFCDKLRNSFNVGEFESYLTTVNNMEGKLNRLYLLTISDRGYIWGK